MINFHKQEMLECYYFQMTYDDLKKKITIIICSVVDLFKSTLVNSMNSHF